VKCNEEGKWKGMKVRLQEGEEKHDVEKRGD